MRDADPIFEMYIHESTQMIELTESIVLDYEQQNALTDTAINEIFRNMHTLKGSSAMMGFTGITDTAHALEDLFQMLREDREFKYSFTNLSNIILQCVDYFKREISAIANHSPSDEQSNSAVPTITLIQQFIQQLQQKSDSSLNALVTTLEENSPLTTYQAHLRFTDDCEMENIRAFQTVHKLEDSMIDYSHVPEKLIEDETSQNYIREHGFQLTFRSKLALSELEQRIQQTSYLASAELIILDVEDVPIVSSTPALASKDSLDSYIPVNNSVHEQVMNSTTTQQATVSVKSSVISVNVQKLDRLMDLVGELVISEAMLNSELARADSPIEARQSSQAAQRNQLRKITGELQDTIMAIRMIPLSPSFHRMRRLTRDMSQKLDKEVHIELIGEETEIDKSVIDQIADPLMHIVRNAMDHGIEQQHIRQANGKQPIGKITLEARNIGSDVLLIITDDGQGIDRERLIQKAYSAGLLAPHQVELSDREAYHLIFHPGLSTKEVITEFSGRGVGMDVVAKNIEQIGGTIYIDSELGKGTSITIKIPLTLAIIDGMTVRVGNSHYTLPTTSIKESFRPGERDLLTDPAGNLMVMVRGECYSIINLAHYLKQHSQYNHPTEGILVMIENESRTICLLVDELIGQQQVVIKPLPPYFKQFKRLNAFSGCTLLGNGNISIIMNMAELVTSNHTTNSL
ncbi:chemotaxis protein CheA [Paenibacillus endoradicis]|uniref:chemotaxis protein CheA n=1 Tax=Paenibacillus endoradicis TaxID=2972487 RepID=UPI002158D5A9|nr:chemotaxis protein CheA [Paenibacillus endoradicis]MCR8659666.1 chemotaxis protein CheA [Paenibacillus endoradicis]